jgi:membrane protease YdiL (CAAX protease family)
VGKSMRAGFRDELHLTSDVDRHGASRWLRVAICVLIVILHLTVSDSALDYAANRERVLIVNLVAEHTDVRTPATPFDLPAGRDSVWTRARCESQNASAGAIEMAAVHESNRMHLRCRFHYPARAPYASTEVGVEQLDALLATHGLRLRPDPGLSLTPTTPTTFSDPVLFGAHVGYAFGLAWLLARLSGWRLREDWNHARRGMQQASIRWLTWSPLLAALLVAGISSLVTRAGIVALWDGGGNLAPFTRAIGAVLVAPVSEEFLFRGWIFLLLADRVRPGLLILFTATAFAAAHPSSIVSLISTGVVGVLLARLWYRSRSLMLCMLAHAVANLPVLTAVLIARL